MATRETNYLHWLDYLVMTALLTVSLGIGVFFALYKGGQKTKVSRRCENCVVQGTDPKNFQNSTINLSLIYSTPVLLTTYVHVIDSVNKFIWQMNSLQMTFIILFVYFYLFLC